MSLGFVWKALADGESGKAQTMLDDFLHSGQTPGSLDSIVLGACWVQLGQLERGLPLLERDWAGVPPESAGIAGAALFGQGLLTLALPALQRATTELPEVAAHAVNFGRCLTLMGRAEDALCHLDRGLSLLGPEHSLAVRSKAEALFALGRMDEALRVLPAQSPQDEVVCARAALLGSAGRHDDAAVLLADSLQERPDSPPLLLMAAELAELRGRTGQAVSLLKTALDKDPDNIPLWVQLATTGRAGKAHPAAKEAAATALALAEGKEPYLQALAQVAQGHVLAADEAAGSVTVQAEAAYRKALELAPGLLPALSGLGHLLMQQGQVGEAVRCFEQVRAAAPLQGWSQLIQARQVPDDPEVLVQMEDAARQPSIQGPVHSSLLFILAAAHEKKKNHDKAMILAIEANAASKKLLPYTPEGHRARVEKEIGFFSEAFMAPRRAWGHPSRLPVFVLGMPRSGTTLTEQILGSHSGIHGAGELGQMGEQIARMEAWEHKLGSGLRYPECLSDLTPTECHKYAERMLENLQAYCPGAQRVVDKLPHNFEHIGLIKLLFPNAHIIHMRRDSRDIAISNFFTDYGAKFGGMGFAYDWRWIGEQLVDHDRLMAHWHRLFPGQILEVQYEALVDDTEGWARRMIDFVGMPWEPGVLNFQDLERSVKTASVWQVRQPVYTTSKERWRRYEAYLHDLNRALSDVPPPPYAWPQSEVPPGLFSQGMAHLEQGQAAQAEQCFKRLLTVRPQHAAAHQFLGVAALHQGRVQEACALMRRSVALMPANDSWFNNLALAEAAADSSGVPEQAKRIPMQSSDEDQPLHHKDWMRSDIPAANSFKRASMNTSQAFETADDLHYEITTSRQFLSWLREEQLSLALSTYQIGKLMLLGLKPQGDLSVFERTFGRSMGLAATDNGFYLASLYQIWRLENQVPAGTLYEGYDRVYVPQVGYTTGDLDVHDMGVTSEGELVFVNTLFGCLAGLSRKHSFKPLWRPPFLSKLAAEDRCHLNGLAMREGKPAFVTCVSTTDAVDGWREHRRDGGVVIDVASNEIVARGLSMPHSPRWHQDRLWVANSGTGEFGYIDLATGRFEPVAFCSGYIRGVTFHRHYAIVGLSRPRHNKTFSGLALDDKLAAKGVEPRCGLQVIDLRSGDIVHWLRFEGLIQELYDVIALPGVQRPMALGFVSDEIRRMVSVET